MYSTVFTYFHIDNFLLVFVGPESAKFKFPCQISAKSSFQKT